MENILTLMKKLLLLLILILPSCLRLTVTGGEVANKVTGLNRNIDQVKADLDLKKQLINSIDSAKKSFLTANNMKNFGYYDINVMEGRVLLTGAVYEEKIKSFIISKITENIKVRELLDELVVSTVDKNYIKDFFIKKTITTKIFFRTKVRSMNYELSVMNGYVYVIGIADSQEELELLTKAISTVKGVKQVVSYVITVDSDKKIKFEY